MQYLRQATQGINIFNAYISLSVKFNDYLTGTNQRTTTYMMRLELRELGETSIARRTTR